MLVVVVVAVVVVVVVTYLALVDHLLMLPDAARSKLRPALLQNRSIPETAGAGHFHE